MGKIKLGILGVLGVLVLFLFNTGCGLFGGSSNTSKDADDIPVTTPSASPSPSSPTATAPAAPQPAPMFISSDNAVGAT